MGMFNIVVVGLIAGISGTTVAEISPHGIRPTDLYAHGLADLIVLLLESGKGVENFRAGCDEYGGPETYNNLRKSAKELSVSLIAAFTSRWDDSEGLCSKNPELSSLYKNLLLSYKNCLEPKTRDNVDYVGVWLPLIKFQCDIQANLTWELYHANSDCLSSDYGSVPHECFIRMYGSNDSRLNAAELASHLLTSDVSREECKIIDEMRACIMEPFQRCSDSRPTDMAKAAFRIIDEHTSCDKFIRSSAAPSVVATVVQSPAASSVDNQVIP